MEIEWSDPKDTTSCSFQASDVGEWHSFATVDELMAFVAKNHEILMDELLKDYTPERME